MASKVKSDTHTLKSENRELKALLKLYVQATSNSTQFDGGTMEYMATLHGRRIFYAKVSYLRMRAQDLLEEMSDGQ